MSNDKKLTMENTTNQPDEKGHDANNVLAVVAFIEAEIPKMEAERNKYKEPYNHAMYMNTDRRLDGAKLFLEWVVSNYR
jgi:hypothetical protein